MSDTVREVKEALLARGFAHTLFAGLDHKGPPSGGNQCCTCPTCGKDKLYYSLDKPVWNCFVCGESGDWFTWLKKTQGMDFPEALQHLASVAGVTLEGHDPERAKQSERRSSLLEAAQAICRRRLWEPAGAKVLEYLRARGYDDETINALELGAYVNGAEGNPVAYGLLKQGYTKQEIEASGVLTGGFGVSHQLSLVELASDGRALLMACRTIDPAYAGDDKYRYGQGPHKRHSLTGIHLVRGDSVTVVEGMLDARLLTHLGIPAVPIGGLRFSAEQRAILVRRGIRTLLYCLDADMRGQNAIAQALAGDLREPEGPRPYVATLPAGVKDPDELVTRRTAATEGGPTGLEQLRAALDNAIAGARWLGSLYGRGRFLRPPGPDGKPGKLQFVPWEFGKDRERDDVARLARETLALLADQSDRADFATAWTAVTGLPLGSGEAPGSEGIAAVGLELLEPDFTASLDDLADGDRRQDAAATRGDGSGGGDDGDTKEAKHAKWWERRKYGLHDKGNALLLAEQIRGYMRICPTMKVGERDLPGRGVLRWDGRRWARCEKNEIGQEASRLVQRRVEEAYGHGGRQREIIGSWAMQCHSAKGQRPMIDLLPIVAPELIVLESELDTHPHLFNCLNGVLNLDTGEFMPHCPENEEAIKKLLITKIAPVVYDPAAEWLEWLEFLAGAHTNANLPPEQAAEECRLTIAALARVWGYTLTGYTFLQTMFCHFGPARTGKSTHQNVLRALLGDEQEGGYLAVASTELLLTQRGGAGEHERRLARITKSRAVTMAETNRDVTFDEAQIKRLTGQEPVTARRLYNDEFEFLPQFKLHISSNTKPRLKEGDEATLRRLNMTPWEVQVAVEDRDFDLAANLAREVSGILNWALAGWQDIRSRMGKDPERPPSDDYLDPLGPPPPGVRALAEYKKLSDAAGEFIAACLVFVPMPPYVSVEALHEAFTAWSKDEGYDLRSLPRKPSFGKRVEEELTRRGGDWLLVSKQRGTSGKWEWRGLNMNDDAWRLWQAFTAPPGGAPRPPLGFNSPGESP